MLGYRLHKKEILSLRKYKKEELEEMTTFQLRNICMKEKIVLGIIHNLDRGELINTILRYRGYETELLINRKKEGGFDRINSLLKTGSLIEKSRERIHINLPAKLVLYSGIGILKSDKYKIKVSSDSIKNSNMLIVNDSGELCAILNILKCEGEDKTFYITRNKDLEIKEGNNKNYSILLFNEQSSDELYKIYSSEDYHMNGKIRYTKTSIKDIYFRTLEETEEILAIDFGTSNTSAGAYLSTNYVSNVFDKDILNGKIQLNQINYVKFLDEEKNSPYVETVPTLVYVKDCSDRDNIEYKFGYEAEKLIRVSNYDSNASFFQGIKRWVNNYEKVEEIVDEEGNIAYITRGEIIRKYIKHVINAAEQQFRCKFKKLHLSSPIKLKVQFIKMFEKILSEYTIETKSSMDEGIAVLYSTISKQIEKNSFDHGEEYKALIIDCGGGTTDFSSCRFVIEEGNICFKVYIATTYENGDTNFGGNNITYRIMQYMKIVFANYYKGTLKDLDIDNLIKVRATEIFRHIDEVGVDDIYKDFEEEYLEAEEIIPTRFKEYESSPLEEYKMVKNNFYFLWEIAEKMKKEFFKRTGILRNRFDQDLELQEGDLKITEVSRWNMSIIERGEFVGKYEYPSVVFNIREISKLIKGDIYEVTRKFLDEFYYSGALQEYSVIKLTGQSCKIDIFREALKEFVPGKTIEFKRRIEEDEQVKELKLSCVEGVLKYLNSRKIGDVKVSLVGSDAIVPYSITALEYNKNEKVLVQCKESIDSLGGFISRNSEAQEIEFYLKDDKDNLKYTYTYINKRENYKETTPEKIQEVYGEKIEQDDTDIIVNDEIRFFIFSNNGIWGFNVLPILRENDQLYIGEEMYYPFENDLSEKDFFSGLN